MCMLGDALEYAEFSVNDEEGVGECEGDDAHDEADLRHLRRLDQAGGVGNGVGRRGDGECHGETCAEGKADHEGGDAADGGKLLLHSLADRDEDGHHQRGTGGIADECAEEPADQSGADEDKEYGEGVEGDALHHGACQT